MADSTIYTRAYLKSSARRLVSGKGTGGEPLSDTALLTEFRNHARRWNPVATALVSASDRIIDTVKRCFEMYYEDSESAEDIWIAFIEVPSAKNETATRIHSAKELAESCELPNANFFSHEVGFEWAIPEKYIVHKISLDTLLKRGLQEHYFLLPSSQEVRSTEDVRRYTARLFQNQSPWEIGIDLGFFARKFGARAPSNWISLQLFHDCVWVNVVDDDVVKLDYTPDHAPGCTEIVDFRYFYNLNDGINTSLYEWWLSDIDFLLDCKEFQEYRDTMEDIMTSSLIGCWETWHVIGRDGKIKELSTEEEDIYIELRDKLLDEHERKRRDIELKAVEIGL